MVQIQARPYKASSDTFVAMMTSCFLVTLFLSLVFFRFESFAGLEAVSSRLPRNLRQKLMVPYGLLSAILWTSVVGTFAVSAGLILWHCVHERHERHKEKERQREKHTEEHASTLAGALGKKTNKERSEGHAPPKSPAQHLPPSEHEGASLTKNDGGAEAADERAAAAAESTALVPGRGEERRSLQWRRTTSVAVTWPDAESNGKANHAAKEPNEPKTRARGQTSHV